MLVAPRSREWKRALPLATSPPQGGLPLHQTQALAWGLDRCTPQNLRQAVPYCSLSPRSRRLSPSPAARATSRYLRGLAHDSPFAPGSVTGGGALRTSEGAQRRSATKPFKRDHDLECPPQSLARMVTTIPEPGKLLGPTQAGSDVPFGPPKRARRDLQLQHAPRLNEPRGSHEARVGSPGGGKHGLRRANRSSRPTN